MTQAESTYLHLLIGGERGEPWLPLCLPLQLLHVLADEGDEVGV